MEPSDSAEFELATTNDFQLLCMMLFDENEGKSPPARVIGLSRLIMIQRYQENLEIPRTDSRISGSWVTTYCTAITILPLPVPLSK